MRRFEAVIFDLDGVLWDGEVPHRIAFDEVLSGWGESVTDNEYDGLLGTSVEYTWRWVRDRYRPPVSGEQFWELYSKAFLRLLPGSAEGLPGATSLVAELTRLGVPIAVASSSLREWVVATLQAIGLADSIDAVVAGDDVESGKPEPDIYLEAARKLDLPPQRCLAVEDSASGVAAAKAAGMFVIQSRGASTALPPLPDADLVLERLSDFDLSLIAPPVRETQR